MAGSDLFGQIIWDKEKLRDQKKNAEMLELLNRDAKRAKRVVGLRTEGGGWRTEDGCLRQG